MQTSESQPSSQPRYSQSLLSSGEISRLVQALEDNNVYIFMDFDVRGDIYQSKKLTGRQIKQGIRGLVSHVTHSYKILETKGWSHIALNIGHSVPDSVYKILH